MFRQDIIMRRYGCVLFNDACGMWYLNSKINQLYFHKRVPGEEKQNNRILLNSTWTVNVFIVKPRNIIIIEADIAK